VALSQSFLWQIYRNKVFKDIAKRGKTSTGWFFGFKLHIINQGEIMNFSLTPGNVDDKKVVEQLVGKLQGWIFGEIVATSARNSLHPLLFKA